MPRKFLSFDPVELRRLYLDEDMSSEELAAHFDCDGQSILNHLAKHGIPRKPQASRPGHPQPNKARKMEQNGFWRGGWSVDKDGYMTVKNPGHPFATKAGYVRLHRTVMEEHLGRLLSPTEVVHHRDDDPRNNALENLQLFDTNAAHLAETLRGKCPEWSEEGFQRMRQNGVALAEKGAAIRQGLEAYARMHSESPSHFLKSLAKADLVLLRMAVELGKFEPLSALRSKRGTIQEDWLSRQSPRSRRSWDRKLASQG